MGNSFYNRPTVLKMNKSIIISFFSFVFILMTNINFSQKNLRVGYVNMDYILSNIEDYTKAKEEYDLRINKWKSEIKKKNFIIAQSKNELEIKRPLIPNDIYQSQLKEIEFEQKNLNEYINKRFGAEGDWLVQEKILIQPIQDEVLAAVQKIAEKNKFDYVFDKSTAIIMLYSEKKYDISELILKSILRQEKIDNLEISFDNDKKKLLQEKIKRRKDSLLKLKELKKIKRDSLIKSRRNNLNK